MPQGNTIGTGAVVLTANADGVLTGLERAKSATDRWAANTTKSAAAKAGGSGGGGLFKAMMFGGAVGGAAGVALAGVQAAINLAADLANRLVTVGERAKAYNLAPHSDMAQGVDRAQRGFDRISAAGDEFLFKIEGKLAPTIEKVASALEVVGFVGAEALGVIVDEVTEVVGGFMRWVDGLVGVDSAATTVTQRVMGGLKLLAMGVGYVWDTIKLGPAVWAVVFEKLGWAIGKAFRGMVDVLELVKELPDELRPAGLTDGFFDAARAGIKKSEDDFKAMGDWGRKAFDTWGDSAKQAGKWFDGIAGKFASTDRLAKAFGATMAGAFGRASSEAYSVQAKFLAGNLVTGQAGIGNDPVAVAKKQLEENKKANRHLKLIADGWQRGTTVQILQ